MSTTIDNQGVECTAVRAAFGVLCNTARAGMGITNTVVRPNHVTATIYRRFVVIPVGDPFLVTDTDVLVTETDLNVTDTTK